MWFLRPLDTQEPVDAIELSHQIGLMPSLTKSNHRPMVVGNYDVAADAKGRVILRNTRARHFHVTVLSNGSFLLEPRVLISPAAISSRTLKTLDKSAANFKLGRVSSPLILAGFAKD